MKVTKRKIEANKANAKMGGVKTEEGKMISKMNALKHGILSKEILMSDEDENELLELSDKSNKELQPVGIIEELFADMFVSESWRLKRALRAEKSLLEWKKEQSICFKFPGVNKISEKATADMIVNAETEKFTRYKTTIERNLFRTLHELQRLQSARKGEKVPVPLAIDIDISKDE